MYSSSVFYIFIFVFLILSSTCFLSLIVVKFLIQNFYNYFNYLFILISSFLSFVFNSYSSYCFLWSDVLDIYNLSAIVIFQLLKCDRLKCYMYFILLINFSVGRLLLLFSSTFGFLKIWIIRVSTWCNCGKTGYYLVHVLSPGCSDTT